jgi:hypothetical protein
MNDDLFDQVKTLLKTTAKAHHQAYADTDGFHPDWPLWYAERMQGELGTLLNAKFTVSELVYLIVLADKEQQLEAPGADWATYYTHFFLGRYT